MTYCISLPIILPHSLDDRFACRPYRAVNDEGELLAGAIVLTERRGGCNFAPKSLTIQAAGAAAAAIHNCVGCGDGLVRMIIPDSVKIPMVFLTKADGYTLRNYLQARRNWLTQYRADSNYPMPSGKNYHLGVMGTVVGAGTTSAGDLAALRTISSSFKINIAPFTDTTALRDWADIPNAAKDLCLDHLVRAWSRDRCLSELALRLRHNQQRVGFAGSDQVAEPRGAGAWWPHRTHADLDLPYPRASVVHARR